VAPIGIGLVLSVVYFRVDVLLLERWTTLEAVAQYSAVFRIVDGMRLLPAAVIAVTLPRILGTRDSVFAGRLSIGLLVSGGAVAAMVLLLASPIVLVAYGPQYVAAVPIFRVLLLSTPLLAVNLALTHQLIGWHRQAAYAWTCASALVVNLSLNAWLIPSAGGIGAAWATLGTELAVTAGCLAGLYRAQTSR
jgi:O-antigen/teichoic acid export membrane protein